MSVWYFEYNPYSRAWMAHDEKNIMLSSMIADLSLSTVMKLFREDKAEKIEKINRSLVPGDPHASNSRYYWQWKAEIPDEDIVLIAGG